MSQENVDTVRAVYEEWGMGNFRTGLDIYDPHVLLLPRADSTEADHYLGPEAIRKYTLGVLAAFKTLTMAAEEFIEAEGSVVVAVCQRGLGRESGAPAEMRYFAVWTFRGRAVTRLETFQDRADALEAVGLSE